MSSCWNQYKNTLRYTSLVLLTVLFYFSELFRVRSGTLVAQDKMDPRALEARR